MILRRNGAALPGGVPGNPSARLTALFIEKDGLEVNITEYYKTRCVNMSNTSIELETFVQPEAAAEISMRRPSTTYRVSQSVDEAHNVPSYQTIGRTETSTTITSPTQTAAIITSVTLITAISTLLNGLTTVALPTMAAELNIPDSLILWPTSIQALLNGCTLLLSGTIADALGPRFMYLTGCLLQAGFILGCGLSQNSTEIIVFRGLSGVAISLCLPSAVSIITGSFEGQRRNFAFAAMGGGQPIGFSVGLTLGGVLTDSIGWRWGFYISAILDLVIFGVALWGLPRALNDGVGSDGSAGNTWAHKLRRLKSEIDWIGAIIASASLAMLSYALAAISGNTADIRHPSTIAVLIVAIALIPAFILWVGRQERLGRPAIIPNSLWHNRVFTVINYAVFFTWGSFNALETILTFYFQKVQGLSAMQTSLRFLPAPVSGTASNVLMGLIVHRVAANYLVLFGCTLSVVAPLVMCFAAPHSSYWSSGEWGDAIPLGVQRLRCLGFLANVFNPTGADSLFTISNLLITSLFPAKTQALAGGVFNTTSQIGKAVGLALAQVIASSVTARSKYSNKSGPEALLEGYKATFWFCFATVIATIVICLWGLRNIGKVGHKRD